MIVCIKFGTSTQVALYSNKQPLLQCNKGCDSVGGPVIPRTVAVAMEKSGDAPCIPESEFVLAQLKQEAVQASNQRLMLAADDVLKTSASIWTH